MYHRSSNPASLRLRRILRNQQELSTPTSSATANTTSTTHETTDAAHTTDVRSRGFSQDYSASGKSSSASIVASETADEQQEQPQRNQKHKRRDTFSESSSPVMVYFRKMFLRCFTTRRKKRPRGVATRKMNSNCNYQARDESDCGKGGSNVNGDLHGSANPERKTYASSIPTNEHEMFFALHSKSKPKRNISIGNIHTHTLHTLAGDTHTRLCSVSSPRPSRHNRSRSTGTIGPLRPSRHNRTRSTGSGSKTKHKVPTQSITLPTLEIEQKVEGQPVHLS